MFSDVVKEKEKISPNADEVSVSAKQLILLNDEYNTFDHVIESLMEVCNHTEEQAEQCALITHYKGKCPVRKGFSEELLTLKQQLSERSLSSVISD